MMVTQFIGYAVIAIASSFFLFWIIAEIIDEFSFYPRVSISTREKRQEKRLNKAKLLFISHLTKEQIESFETYKSFVVQGSATGKLYRIHTTSLNMNVQCIDSHKLYCATVPGVPCWDVFLAQKIVIEYDENSFLKVANATRWSQREGIGQIRCSGGYCT